MKAVQIDNRKSAIENQDEGLGKSKIENRKSKIGEGAHTVIGWQGIRFLLPPDWNLTSFSMDRDNGYLRVDAPGDSTLTVQIRWMNAAQTQEKGLSLYALLSNRVRRLRKQPEPPVPKPDLKANLEKMLKETARQSRKAKTAFDSNLKPERVEGENGERTAINFSWTGSGRGQGKIWYCSTCHRIVIAQVVGMAKDQSVLPSIASQLFGSLHDHSTDGYDQWALYDLQIDVPSDFRLEEQKLLSGYLQLVFARAGERIVLDRWGLANMTLKKFTLDEWFGNNARINLKRMVRGECEAGRGHVASHYTGRLSLPVRLRLLRESRGALRRLADRYEGGVWECAETNKIFALQVFRTGRSEDLWDQVAHRCVCHEN